MFQRRRLLARSKFLMACLVVLLVPRLGLSAPMPGDGPVTDTGVTGNSGDTDYSIDIPVPPGTGSFAPALALRYSSERGDGPFGVGWGLDFGEIRRSTRFRQPEYDDAMDQFELGDQVLVVNADASTDTATRYHTFVESFARIVHLRDGAVDRWEVTRPDGTVLRFGSSTGSRIQGLRGRPLRWLLDEMEDPFGNKIAFEHLLEDGEAYPSRVRYTLRGQSSTPVGAERQIEFVYENRPDPSITFMGGVKRTIRKRADRILVRTGEGTYRTLELSYGEQVRAPGDPSRPAKVYATARSRLARAQLSGALGPNDEPPAQQRPPQDFEYRDPGTTQHWQTQGVTIPAGLNLVDGLQKGVRIANVNPEDGFPDLIVAGVDNNAPVRAVYLGNGSGWSTTPDPTWTAALNAVTGATANLQLRGVKLASGQIRPCRSDTAPLSPVLTQARSNVLFFDAATRSILEMPTETAPFPMYDLSPTWTAVDVTGDGLDDLVQSTVLAETVIDYVCGNATPVAPQYTAGMKRSDVWVNNGRGWERNAALSNTLPPLSVMVVNPLVNRYDLLPRFTDFDGDGRNDLVVTSFNVQPGGTVRTYAPKVYRSTPEGFVEAQELAPPTPLVDIVGDDHTSLTYAFRERAVQFVDVNRDGLADTIRSSVSSPLANPCGEFAATNANVWLNTGKGWCDGREGGACSGATTQYLPPAPLRKAAAGLPTSCETQSAGVQFTDLNGDGLVDLLRTDGTSKNNTGTMPIEGGRRAWLHSPGMLGQPVWVQADQYLPPLATLRGLEVRGTNVGSTSPNGVLTADVNADSTLDLVDFSASGANSAVGSVRFSDRMLRSKNEFGGEIEYSYESAAAQRNGFFAQAADGIVNDPNGVLRWTTRPVVTAKRFSGTAITPVTQTFRYAQPRYEESQRTSLGFAFVSSEIPVKADQVYFSQRLGTAGKVKATQVVDRNGSPRLVQQTTFEYEILDGDDPAVGEGSTVGVLVGRLVQRDQAQFSGPPSNSSQGAVLSETFGYAPENRADTAGYGFVTRSETVRATGTLVTKRRMREPDTDHWIVGLLEEELDMSDDIELAKTQYDYSREGRQIELTRFDGRRGSLARATRRTSTFAYDEYGNLRSSTDPSGHASEFCYDGDTMFASGESCGSAAQPAGHSVLVAVRDPLEQLTTFKPDPTTGLIIEKRAVYSGDKELTQYDGFGRPTQLSRQPSGGSPTVVTTFLYANAGTGALDSDVRMDRLQPGSETAVRTGTYRDGFAQEIRRVFEAPAVGGQSRYYGVAIRQDRARLTTTSFLPVSCGADASCSALPADGPSAVKTSVTRDALGRPLTLVTPDGVTKRYYHSVNRTHPDEGPASFDAVLEMDPRGHLTQRILDGDRLVWVEECTGAPLDPATSGDLSTASCTSPAVTFYRYEPTGGTAEVYDAAVGTDRDPTKATQRNVFDSLGRVIEAYDVNRTAATQLSYDEVGQITTEINARGQSNIFEYDELGRTKQITYPLGGVPNYYVFTYDDRTRDVATLEHKRGDDVVFTRSFDYDDFGRRSQETLTYGSNPALVSEFERDLLGRPTRVRYPDLNTEIAYEYEKSYLKRVCELAGAPNCSAATAIPYLSNVSYDTIGRQTVIAGSNLDLDLAAPAMTLTYGADYHVSRLEVSDPGEPGVGRSLDLSYGYDDAGAVETVTDRNAMSAGPADVSFSASYTYDGRNRLASRTRAGQTRYFNYDTLGNLTGKLVDTATATNQTYDVNRRHRVTQAGGMSYDYDADGNVTRRGSQVLTWDALRRMTCLGTSAAACSTRFTYGPDAIRVAEVRDGTLKLYVSDFFEWEPGARKGTAHIFALGRQIAYKHIEAGTLRSGIILQGVPIERGLPVLLAGLAAALFLVLFGLALRAGLVDGLVQQPAYAGLALALCLVLIVPPSAWASFDVPRGTGTYRRWVWQDALGSSIHITNAAGMPVQQRAFEPFGEIAKERNSEPTQQQFAGHEFDPALGLYYMKARWYDPLAGRFLSSDPVILDDTNPQTFNAYSYVENNPLNLTDPTGLFSFTELARGILDTVAGGLGGFFDGGGAAGGGGAPPAPPTDGRVPGQRQPDTTDVVEVVEVTAKDPRKGPSGPALTNPFGGVIFNIYGVRGGESPTGREQRGCDKGCGGFYSPRNRDGVKGVHKSADYLGTPGQAVTAVQGGTVTKLGYVDDKRRFVEISTPDGLKIRELYVLPEPGLRVGTEVNMGQRIGTEQEVTSKYGAGIREHVHVQVERGAAGTRLDPSTFISVPDR